MQKPRKVRRGTHAADVEFTENMDWERMWCHSMESDILLSKLPLAQLGLG